MPRREFLARLAAAAASAGVSASVLGRAVEALAQDRPAAPRILQPGESAPPPAAPAESAAPRTTLVLRNPIVMKPGEILADKRLVLASDFRWTPTKAAIYVPAQNVTIRNVEIVGASSWLTRWNVYEEPRGAGPGICAGMVGIRLQNAARARIEDVSIRGFPGAGIDGYGLQDAVIRGVTVTACFFGLITRQYAPNSGLLIERVEVRDVWGPGPNRWPGVGGPPSQLRPGGFIGSDGIVCHSLRNAVLKDSSVLGEQFASFKLVNPVDTEVSGLLGTNLMIQGTSDLEWKIDKEPSRNVRVRDCTFDKGLGSGAFADNGNAIQVSWHVRDLLIERCTLIAAGKNGHGIQFAVDAHGRVVNCVFEGFNGVRGVTPAHAVEVSDRTSSVNADLAAINTFRNQQRILLRH